MPNQASSAESFNLELDPRFLRLSDEEKNKLRQRSLETQMEAASTAAALAPFTPQQYSLDELGAFREREARRAQELGKESLQEAYKYTTLANIPKTIAQSFGNIAAMNVLGARNATEAMATTLQAYPRISPVNIQFQESKYF